MREGVGVYPITSSEPGTANFVGAGIKGTKKAFGQRKGVWPEKRLGAREPKDDVLS
jgi:hypothetical protein